MAKRKIFILIISLSLLALVSCGGGGSSSGGSSTAGSAPQLTSLTLSPTSAPVGVQTTLTFNFGFNDAQGDLNGGSLVIRDDETNSQVSLALPASFAGLTSGTGNGFLVVVPGPNRGTFTSTAWLIDNKGNQSNTITVPFTVT